MKADKGLRVAIYSGTIPSATFIERLIRGLAENGMEIVLVGRRAGQVSYPRNVHAIVVPGSAIPAFFFTLGQFLKLAVSDAKYAFRLLRSSRRGGKTIHQVIKKASLLFSLANARIDILHLQWGKTLRETPEIFDLKNVRIALSFRGTHINISPLADTGLAAVYRKYFPRIDGFHAVSHAIVGEGIKYGASPEKIRVIYTSVDIPADPENKSAAAQDGTMQIVSVGRFHWVKGYTYALDAMSILKERGIPFHYTLISEGEVPEELIFQISDQGLGAHVTIVPGMPNADLLAALPGFDAFLLSSVGEGIANVVLEAMAAGLPVVSTGIGGMSEVIQDGENGILVEPYSGEAIADGLVRIKQLQRQDLERMTMNARRTLSEKFSSGRQTQEFISFYRSLVTA